MSPSSHKSGFVVLVGRSNVGKSTLLNALVGTKVAIVTPKPQTTRLPVRGILTDEERGQIVFVDTPGVFLQKQDALSLRLNDLVREQLEGIEAVLYIVDPTRPPGPEEEHLQKLLSHVDIPILVLVNKCDLTEEQRPFMNEALNVNVGQQTTMTISALRRQDLNRVVDHLFSLLPEGEWFYPPMQLTDLSHRDWMEELIREKVFLRLRQELPYTVKVEVTDMSSPNEQTERIEATVWTTEERYKRMLIGAGAQMIKQIGMDARKELEASMGKKVFLQLDVQVDPEWPKRFLYATRS
mgnify:CR=1 FL=1